jgi:hypothetical protein
MKETMLITKAADDSKARLASIEGYLVDDKGELDKL